MLRCNSIALIVPRSAYGGLCRQVVLLYRYSVCMLFLSLQDFLDGQNCLVFSYGVTNSGKTHTIHGTADDPGIIPRVLDSVFASLDDSLYQGDHLKPKNYSEVEWLSGKGMEKEKGIREQIFSKVRMYCIHTYICKYVCTYVCKYICTYVRTYVTVHECAYFSYSHIVLRHQTTSL